MNLITHRKLRLPLLMIIAGFYIAGPAFAALIGDAAVSDVPGHALRANPTAVDGERAVITWLEKRENEAYGKQMRQLTIDEFNNFLSPLGSVAISFQEALEKALVDNKEFQTAHLSKPYPTKLELTRDLILNVAAVGTSVVAGWLVHTSATITNEAAIGMYVTAGLGAIKPVLSLLETMGYIRPVCCASACCGSSACCKPSRSAREQWQAEARKISYLVAFRHYEQICGRVHAAGAVVATDALRPAAESAEIRAMIGEYEDRVLGAIALHRSKYPKKSLGLIIAKRMK